MTTPGILQFSGSYTFNTGNFSGNGTLKFAMGSSTVNLSASYELAGLTQVLGVLTINYASPLAHSTGQFTVETGGTLLFSGSHVFDSGADFSGGGEIEFVTGPFTIDSSYMLSGETRVNGQVILNFPVSPPASTANFNVSGSLLFSGGHTFDPGSSFSGAGSVEFASGGAYVIHGNYTLTGETIVKGTVQINYAAPTSDSTGSMNVSGTLVISGSHNFGLGADFIGAGTVNFKSGAIGFGSIYNLTGTTTISGATVVLSGATLTSLGATLNLTSGSLYFGSLDTSVAAFNWSGGVMGGSGGATIVPAGGQLNFSGADALVLSTRNLTNNGTATWDRQAGDSYLFIANGAVFTNSASATFDLQNSGTYVFNGTGSLTNEGIFNKNNSNAAVIAGIAFFNHASGGDLGVNVNEGSLEIGSFSTINSSSTGSYKVPTGATLIFSGSATHTFESASAISGAGNVEFRAGTQNFYGTYAISGITTVSGTAVSRS